MGNAPGSLTLDDLDDRLVDALRDSSVASATRYTYLQDAYSRIWYKKPWIFTHQSYTFTASAGVATYTLSSSIAEVAAMFNTTRTKSIMMNKGIFMYFDSYNDDNHSGPIYNLADLYEDGHNIIAQFQEVPSANQGHGDTITVYYCKHLIHNLSSPTASAGTTATGNMSSSADVPAFAPQFHALIVKEALLEAIKNRRDFEEMYKLVKLERDEMYKDMERHYLTPRRSGTLGVYR